MKNLTGKVAANYVFLLCELLEMSAIHLLHLLAPPSPCLCVSGNFQSFSEHGKKRSSSSSSSQSRPAFPRFSRLPAFTCPQTSWPFTLAQPRWNDFMLTHKTWDPNHFISNVRNNVECFLKPLGTVEALENLEYPTLR